jgi:hypothetical protein
MSRSPSHVPDLLIEQLLLGEIRQEDERWLRQQLSVDEIERRLSVLRQANERHAQQHDAVELVEAIRARKRVTAARAQLSSKSGSGFRLLVPGLAAAFLVLFVVARPNTERPLSSPAEVSDTTRVKGLANHLVLHRRTGNDAETLAHNAHAKSGDVLQLGYVAAKARHGVIFSIDGAGAVTLHFPESERASTELSQGGEQLLPNAYQLDDAPLFERFFFVTSERSVDAGFVLKEARALSARGEARSGVLNLKNAAIEQQSLTLVKE